MENLGLGYDQQERLAELGGLIGAAGADPFVERFPQPPMPPAAAPGQRTVVVGLLSDNSELPPFSLS